MFNIFVGKINNPTITELIAAIKTAPAITSFAILAFILYSFVIKSIVVSNAVFNISANNTKNIENSKNIISINSGFWLLKLKLLL